MTKKTVAALLLTGLAISLLGAVLTLLLHAPILGYQRAHQPHADPAALSRTLWTRPLTVFVVAILYARFVRQLLRGDPRALRRVRIVSAAGLAGVCWLLVSAAYPAWLRAIQIGQLVVLAALVITVNLRTVRSAFDAPVPPDPRPRNGRAAWTLILLTPVVAELTMGNVALRDLIYFPIFIPIYGAGALLIRETTRRLGGGTAGLLLLGLAYGILEEGLALQGLTSPHLYHAADWAPRLLGLNTAYAELNLIYHPVFSVLIPITLTEHLFRTHGDRPYLRRGGLISTAVVAALGAGLLRIAVPPTMDPGYQVPLLPAVLFLTVAALLAAAAYGVRRKPARRGRRAGPRRDRRVDRCRRPRLPGPDLPVRRRPPAVLHPRHLGAAPDGRRRGHRAPDRPRPAPVACRTDLDRRPPARRLLRRAHRAHRVRPDRQRRHAPGPAVPRRAGRAHRHPRRPGDPPRTRHPGGCRRVIRHLRRPLIRPAPGIPPAATR